MTHQQSYLGAENPVVEFQRLTFQLKKNDGCKAVFQAIVGDIPGAQVLGLTVTVPSPGEDKEAKAAYATFLDELRVALVPTAPRYGKDPLHGREPGTFKIHEDIIIDSELVRPSTIKGLGGVAVIVHDTAQRRTLAESLLIGPLAFMLSILAFTGRPSALRLVLATKFGETLSKGLDREYKAGGAKFTATLEALGGKGSIRRPGHKSKKVDSSVVKKKKRSVTGKKAIVHSNSKPLYYNLYC
jgi:hypothetical protein